MAKSEESNEFKKQKRLLEIKYEFDVKKHELKMKELAEINKNNVRQHDREMERQRIKTAEIRKRDERRAMERDAYWKK